MPFKYKLIALLALVFTVGLPTLATAQMSIPAGGTVTQNFNSIGSSGSATLPTGFKIGTNYASGTTVTTQAAGTSGTGAITGSSAGGTYNFANGVTGSSTDRAIGFLSSGSFTSPQGIMVQVRNNSGSAATSINVSFNYEKYRTGTRAFDWDFYSSTDGVNWTAQTAGDQSYAADGANAVVNPPSTINKSFTISGINVANGSNIYFRWQYTGSGGSSNGQGLGIDDVTFTIPPIACTPTKLLFSSQPTSTQQSATIPSFTVEVACANNSTYTACNSGTVTLSFSGCGISGTLSKTPVNGIATFNNLVVSRSAQSNVTFTATYSGSCGGGLTPATSGNFNITIPGGGITTIARHNFDGTNTWNGFSTAIGGAGVFSLSGNTRGVTGACLAQYYDDCLTGAAGSPSTAIFSENSLGSYSNLKLKFRLSAGGPRISGDNCGDGDGVDTDDYIKLESRINGGAWNNSFQMNGQGNYQYGWNNNALALAHNAASTANINSEPSVVTITLPSGTASVEFRFTFKNNRSNEIWYIDNVELEGNAVGTPSPLPTANAGANYAGCPGGPNPLLGSASNTVGIVSYAWTPSSNLSNATVANPMASNTVVTTYTLTITDDDDCIATDQITVSLLGGATGLWTGVVSQDWFNCKNWADGRVPSTTTDVTVPNVTNQPDITEPNALCRNIAINSGADLSMTDASGELEVNGSFTNNSGTSLGLATISGATVLFTGSGNYAIGGSSPINFQRLLFNKNALSNTITVNTNLTILELTQITRGTLEISELKTIETEVLQIQNANSKLVINPTAAVRVND